jgi:hypothetical protein
LAELSEYITRGLAYSFNDSALFNFSYGHFVVPSTRDPSKPVAGFVYAKQRAAGAEMRNGIKAAVSALLAVAALISAPARAAPAEPSRPYSFRLFDDEQRKCAFGSCDARAIERLRKECLRDGGRP